MHQHTPFVPKLSFIPKYLSGYVFPNIFVRVYLSQYICQDIFSPRYLSGFAPHLRFPFSASASFSALSSWPTIWGYSWLWCVDIDNHHDNYQGFLWFLCYRCYISTKMINTWTWLSPWWEKIILGSFEDRLHLRGEMTNWRSKLPMLVEIFYLVGKIIDYIDCDGWVWFDKCFNLLDHNIGVTVSFLMVDSAVQKGNVNVMSNCIPTWSFWW